MFAPVITPLGNVRFGADDRAAIRLPKSANWKMNSFSMAPRIAQL